LDLARFKVALEARRLRSIVRRAERREALALERAGAHIRDRLRLTTGGANGGTRGAADDPVRAAPDDSARVREDETVRDLCARIDRAADRASGLHAALDGSLAADRRDFAHASELARWAVIARGTLDRFVLREQARIAERERASHERDLGRAAFDGAHSELRARTPEAVAKEIDAARADALAARAMTREITAPYGGDPLPRWLRAAVRETRAFALHVWKELSSRIFVRAPALAGLFAGWWITRTFTDSALESVLHDVGLGGRRGISPATMSELAFWLPLLAAALCSYLGAFVGARIQRRYTAEASAKT